MCPNCVAGNPLKVGVEGRARFFSSQSIDLRSPVFGFTETGSTGSTTDYSAMFDLACLSTRRADVPHPLLSFAWGRFILPFAKH